jgi:UDP-2,3-diacylglucosamine pyrophosphatase LpxH
MKRSTIFSLVAVAVLFVFAGSQGYSQEAQVNWDVFGKNLTKALQSDNEGLQQSAMRLIIRHGDKLNVKEAAFNVVHVFRTNKDPKVRQLAMVTLYNMRNDRAMYFLKRNIQFEKDENIRKFNCCIVNAYYAQKEAANKEPVIIISSR